MSTELKASDRVLTMSVPENSDTELTPTSMSIASEFHGFAKLPPELRLMIWEEARPEARVVKVSKKKKKWFRPRLYDTYSRAKTPAMLHATHESRTVAVKWYTLPIGCAGYLDLSRDYQYFQCCCKGKECDGYMDCVEYRITIFPPNHYVSPPIVSSKVIFECDQDSTDRVLLVANKHHGKITELLLVDVKKGLGGMNEGKLTDFLETTDRFRPERRGTLFSYYRFWHRQSLGALPNVDVSMEPLTKISRIQRKDVGEDEDIRLIQALELIEQFRGSYAMFGWLILALVAYFVAAYNLRGSYARHKWWILADVVYLVTAYMLWSYLFRHNSVLARWSCFADW